MDRAYLDHAATTPLDPRVLDAMLPVLRDGWGNPSGVYREAQKAHGLLDDARDAIAASLECSAREIILTSGGTESDNLAIRGVARSRSHAGRHLITSAIEHHAVLHPMEALADEGFEVTVLPVDAEGFVDPAAVAAAVRDDTILVSIMAANNEIGTLQPIAEISRAVKERNRRTVVHSDAVQAAGAIDIRPDILGVDLMSLTAHKIYGPKGIGLLYHRRRTPLEPTMLGGGQEEERRAGTENVASAAGLARALQLATDERDSRTDSRPAAPRRPLARAPRARPPDPPQRPRRLVAPPAQQPPRLLPRRRGREHPAPARHGRHRRQQRQRLQHRQHRTQPRPHRPGNVDPDTAHSALRLSLGQSNTEDHVERLGSAIPQIISRLRALAPCVGQLACRRRRVRDGLGS